MDETRTTNAPLTSTNLRALGLLLEGRRITLRRLSWEKPVILSGGTDVTNCHFGAYSYLNRNSVALNVTTGRYSSLADHCRIGLEMHPTDWATTHCFSYFNMFSGVCGYQPTEYFEYQKPIRIGNDVWIGAHTVVMPGVTIGDGAIVGAGSVVTHDVPPYTIVSGTPARTMRQRFSDSICQDLVTTQWWSFDLPGMMQHGLTPPFRDPTSFALWIDGRRDTIEGFRLSGQTMQLNGVVELA